MINRKKLIDLQEELRSAEQACGDLLDVCAKWQAENARLSLENRRLLSRYGWIERIITRFRKG